MSLQPGDTVRGGAGASVTTGLNHTLSGAQVVELGESTSGQTVTVEMSDQSVFRADSVGAFETGPGKSVGGNAQVSLGTADSLDISVAGAAIVTAFTVHGPADITMAGGSVGIKAARDNMRVDMTNDAMLGIDDFSGKRLELNAGGRASVAIQGQRTRVALAELPGDLPFADNIRVGGEAIAYVAAAQLGNIFAVDQAEITIGQLHGNSAIAASGHARVVIEAMPTSDIVLRVSDNAVVMIGGQEYSNQSGVIQGIPPQSLIEAILRRREAPDASPS